VFCRYCLCVFCSLRYQPAKYCVISFPRHNVSRREKLSLFTVAIVCQQLGVLWHDTITISNRMYMIFTFYITMLQCRPTYATHKENSVNAHNPNTTCPLKWFRVCCLTKCRQSQKSFISVLELKSLALVLGSWVLVLEPRVLVIILAKSLLFESLKFAAETPPPHLYLTTSKVMVIVCRLIGNIITNFYILPTFYLFNGHS